MKRNRGRKIVIGTDLDTSNTIRLGAKLRTLHALILGSPDRGKSKLIEQGFREDVKAGIGGIIIDPHGTLFDDCLRWLESSGYAKSRRIHLIDPGSGFTTGFNPLPNTREFVRGVINLRGTIVPIFDLRARFGEGQTSPTKNHVVVVMSVGEKWVGILVDAVSDILTVSKDDIHVVPEGNSNDTELLNGIVTHDSRMVGLIDLRAVVSDARVDG